MTTEAPAVLRYREYKIYEALREHLGQWVLYGELCKAVNDYDDACARAAIRTHVARLRAKLPSGAIETSFGVGYRLVREAPVERAVYK